MCSLASPLSNTLLCPQKPEYNRHIIGPPSGDNLHKMCIVLDLDETLVHSSFQVSTFRYNSVTV